MNNQSFRRIDDWIQHMRWDHTLRWYCGVSGCQNQVFDEQKMFENHMEHFHLGTYSSAQLPILVESMRRPATDIFECCPLCNYTPEDSQTIDGARSRPISVSTAISLHKHVATHLEGLALLSLPWQDNEDDRTSSGMQTLWREKRSTLKNAGIGGVDEDVSLSFEDPPNIELLRNEHQDVENLPPYETSLDGSGEAEWGFVPPLTYEGHSQDPRLQGLIRKQLNDELASQERRKEGLVSGAGLTRSKYLGNILDVE